MKKKVYDFITQHPWSTAGQCADALQIDGLEELNLIHKLHQERYLKSAVLPLGNNISSDNSNFYSVCKTYSE